MLTLSQNGSTERIHGPRNAAFSHRNARIPIEQTQRDPTLASPRSFRDTSSTFILVNTHLSSLATSISADTSSGGTFVPPSRHLTDTQNDLPISTNAPTEISVAIDRSPVSCSTAATRHGSDTPPEVPSSLQSLVPSVAPNTQEHLDVSPSPISHRYGRHENAQSARSSTLPPVQAMVMHARRCSQGKVFGAATSPPIGPPNLRPTRDHSTNQQDVPGSHQDPDSSEDPLPQQCHLLSLLLRYMFYRDDKKVDENTLLKSLEQVWMSHEHSFKLALEPRFNGCREALRIWIGLRRKTNELRSLVQRQSSAQTLDLVDRALAMNEVRMLHWQWEELRAPVDGQAISPEDLLCSTFAIMTRTEEMEMIFMKGLDNIRKTLPNICSSGDSVISIHS
jgi:hypothetical protein